MYPSLRASVSALLNTHHPRITFVDVGSRNGILELADLAPFVDAYGFEPNPVEFAKLQSGQTDAVVLKGRASPPYHALRYFPYALSDRDGRQTFYVTPSAGACSLLQPDLEKLRPFIWAGRSFRGNFADDVFAGSVTTEVDVRTLDTVMQENKLSHIDYLKLDIQGSEYPLLEGARNILPRVGVLKTEVCFLPFYKNQKIFSHMDILLRECGFELLGYEITRAHAGYKERLGPVEYLPRDKRYPDLYAQILWGDAFYVNRAIADPERVLAQTAVLLDHGYVDEAAYLLHRAKAPVSPAFLQMLRTFRHEGGRTERIRRRGYAAVDAALRCYGRLLRKR